MDQLTCFTHEYDGERLRGVRAPAAHGPDGTGRPVAVLLHGAGNGSERRLRPLLAEFAAHGCPALAFDFSGHGESTGVLGELSLRRRFEQATAVIDAQVRPESPLILVGFSMSGQTVADLVRHYGDRASAIGLCSPAVYTPQAWDVPFGDGTGRFTELIRTPDAWRTSPALEVLRCYAGRAVLAVPGTDAVIPPQVTAALQNALRTRSRYTRFELPDAEHRLGLWFRDHPDDRREFVALLLKHHG
ncbi:alpha/beta hydrolase [Streptomyces sp.]|uniref:alpha/beta hydrolase n=1 Tax=Streptomyces sp. TaxID=1931 RepID=UPI0025F43D22|nr:alpha/beta hydrolase [Streptomyces sp.]